MEREQVLISILLVSLLLIFLVGFLFLMLFLQRRKTNQFISERERMKRQFDEQLLRSQLEIQELSFNTISMEIHDNVGQTLSLLKMQLNIMSQKRVFDEELLDAAKGSAGKAMSDLRDIAKGLNSERLSNLSLPDMISEELLRIGSTMAIHVSMRIENREVDVKSDSRVILFRIIQECLQNVIKHSQATKATVCLCYLPQQLNIDIIDNGKGFNQEKEHHMSSGMGLHNIFNRAKIIGGEAKINSVITKGTTVSIFSPYE